jgi:uncharacterized protein YbbC (DUF1343 family)/CubicO group peptidase (beta-lactamase class C family)
MSNFRVRRKVRTISKSVIATAIFLLAAVAAAKDWARDVDAAVEDSINRRQIPGAVVWIGRGDRTLLRKAYGYRALKPSPEPMTVDTVFDLASLTKIIVTATAVTMLVEEGKLRLSDRVSQYVPEFGVHGKENITLRHMLTHTSGLRPSLDLDTDWRGTDEAIRRAVMEVPQSAPGERFVYSDIGYIVLGEVVARVSGMPIEQFSRERILGPLRMRSATFRPDAAQQPNIAPTQYCTAYGWPCEGPDQIMLRGVVHDPTARRLGGVAGHAGLFASAEDLSRYVRMILRGGELDGRRILSPLGVTRMTSPATPPELAVQRGLGWDIDSSYSANRGDLYPIGSFGHTGFTGTSIWIDPLTQTYVILLTNRVHPDGKGDATPLRSKVATIVAAAFGETADLATLRERRYASPEFQSATTVRRAIDPEVRNGIDVLRARDFAVLRGKRVGLLTNQTGISRDGNSTADLLFAADGVKLMALFSPEHGIRGELDEKVPSSRDTKTGLPIHSLYGETQRPTSAMLEGLDIIVIDLQDEGARFYTYATSMAYMLEEASKRKLPVVILDRVNPIDGASIEGPSIDISERSFTAYQPMPIRHGMTMGELARYFNAAAKLDADLTVVPVEGWDRRAYFEETGLPWVNPSPNLRNLVSAVLYPGVATVEGANVSVGRGTDTPFQVVGAPWIDAQRLAKELNQRNIPGLRAYPTRFTPRSSKFSGEPCNGIFFVVTDRQVFRPVRLGLELADALNRTHSGTFEIDRIGGLFGREVVRQLRTGLSPAAIADSWRDAESAWRQRREEFLLYR